MGGGGSRWIVIGGGRLYLWVWVVVVVGLGKKKFFGCGFHVIVGGGGVGLIPCDLGCINGVDLSLHFFFFESFVLILRISF